MSEQEQHLQDVKDALERAMREAKELTKRVSADLEEQARGREEHRVDPGAFKPKDQ